MLNLNDHSGPIRRDTRGASALETALLFPIFMILVCGIIEFGYYFLKEEVVARSVSVTARAIQDAPTNPDLKRLAKKSGGGIISYDSGGNFICAKAYSSVAAAASGLCSNGHWNVSPPAGVAAGTPYYVAVKALSPYNNITPIMNFLSGFMLSTISSSVVIQIGGNAAAGTFQTVVTRLSGGGAFTCSRGMVTSCVTTIDYNTNQGLSCQSVINGNTCYYGTFPDCFYGSSYPMFTTVVCGYVQ